MNKPDLTEIKEIVKTPQMGTQKKIKTVYSACMEYAKESKSLRIVGDIRDTASSLLDIYEDCFGYDEDGNSYIGEAGQFERYVYNHDAFDAAFAKLESLLDEAEQKVAVSEAEDILLDNFFKNHPDAEFD